MTDIPERIVMQCNEHDQENCSICNEERYAMYCASGDDGHIECEGPQLRARIRELEQERALCAGDLPEDFCPKKAPIARLQLYVEHMEAQLQAVTQERDQLSQKLNTPELLSFRDAVVLEAAHQRERLGSEHDDGKQPSDWFWLIGYLAGKALAAHSAHVMIGADPKKALHHTISTAAALANWHASILDKTNMRPGIMKPADAALTEEAQL